MTIKTGSIVKFAKPESSEVEDVFQVVELRGERALFAEVSGRFDHWSIRPTFVYSLADMVEV